MRASLGSYLRQVVLGRTEKNLDGEKRRNLVCRGDDTALDVGSHVRIGARWRGCPEVADGMVPQQSRDFEDIFLPALIVKGKKRDPKARNW